MATTKVTRKGQVTIPAEIRQKLDIREGDLLLVREIDGKVVMESQRDIAERLAGVFVAYAKHGPRTREERHETFVDALTEEYLDSRRDV